MWCRNGGSTFRKRPFPPARQPPAASVAGLTIATAIALGVVGLAHAGDAAARFNDSAPNWAASVAGVVAFAVLVPLFLVWFWMIRRNAGRWGHHRHAQGWAIGGWFVPGIFVWVPYQISIDAWRASQPPSAEKRSTALVTAWWVCWLLAWITGFNVTRTSDAGYGTSTRYGIDFGATLPSACFAAAAALLGAVMVWTLGRMQQARTAAESMPAVLDRPIG